MQGNRFALVLVGSVVFGLGAIAIACGSNPATNGVDGGTDGGIVFSSSSSSGGSSVHLATSSATLGQPSSSVATSVPTGSASSPTGGSNSATSASATSPSGSSGGSSASSGGSSSSSAPSGSASSSQASSRSSQSSSASASSAATCFKPPVPLHPESSAGVYCPFSSVDGGSNITCAAGQHCCETPESANSPSTCEPAATACPVAMSTDWQCEGTPDCAGTTGTICCGTGTIKEQAAQPGCGDAGATVPPYPYVSGFTGSTCAATCAAYQICSQTSECSGGKTCTPIEPKGNGIGYCK